MKDKSWFLIVALITTIFIGHIVVQNKRAENLIKQLNEQKARTNIK